MRHGASGPPTDSARGGACDVRKGVIIHTAAARRGRCLEKEVLSRCTWETALTLWRVPAS